MEKMMNREELLERISAVCFMMDDIKLFLDTHPCDKDMLEKYGEYQKMAENLKEQYTAFYGPLSAESYVPEDRWKWIDNPWPWNC